MFFNHEKKQIQVHMDTLDQVTRQRNRAYQYLVIIMLSCFILSCAVWILATIHTVVPVIAVVDAQGHVVKQSIVSSEQWVGDERVVQSEIYNFIQHCNTYDPVWRQHYADLCRLHASTEVAKQYTQEISQVNGDNPYVRLGKDGRIYPKVTGIHRLDEQQFQVSYQLVTEQSGSIIRTDYYRALISYAFTGQPLSLGDRWENALGFAVTAYRKEAELNLSQEGM